MKTKQPKALRIRGEIGANLRIYDCPGALCNVLNAKLTFRNPAYDMASRFSPWGVGRILMMLSLLEVYDDRIEIPRGFDPSTLEGDALREWNSIAWEDCRVALSAKKLTLAKGVAPNAEQKAVLKHFASSLESSDFGTFMYKVPTSGGKTFLQCLLARETGMRTLVLCKTNLIKKAWLDDLYKMFGLREKDLGIIQQKSYVMGNPITLASISTLSRRKHLWGEIFSKVGCLIIDECQILGSDTVREIVQNCPAKYVIGLSATPERRDGKTKVVMGLLGKPKLSIQNKQEETGSSFPLHDAEMFRTMSVYKDSKGRDIKGLDIVYSELIERLSTDAERNKLIVSKAMEDYNSGRSVVITTPRLEHQQELVRLLIEAGASDTLILNGSTNSKKVYTQGLINDILARRCRMLVASENAIALGANINALDRLHVCFPSGQLEQLVGRIRRKHEGKKDCKLRIYWDIKIPFMHNKVKRIVFPVLRKLKVPRFANMYVA